MTESIGSGTEKGEEVGDKEMGISWQAYQVGIYLDGFVIWRLLGHNPATAAELFVSYRTMDVLTTRQ